MKCAPLVLASLMVQPGGAFGPAPCRAHLEIQQEQSQQQAALTITGHCRSLTTAPARYRYQLVLKRHGSSGHSQNSQGGEFALAASEDVVLARVRLATTGPHGAGSVHLLVLDAAGQVVSQDSAHF